MRPLDLDFSLTTASTASFGLDDPTFSLNDPISASMASFGLNDPIPASTASFGLNDPIPASMASFGLKDQILASIGLRDPILASMASVKGLVHHDPLTKLSQVKRTRLSWSFNEIIPS